MWLLGRLHYHVERHPGGPAFNIQSPAELLHARRHPLYADAPRKPVLASNAASALAAIAIVSDDQMEAVGDKSEINRCARCRGVPVDVGQGLLHDAQD